MKLYDTAQENVEKISNIFREIFGDDNIPFKVVSADKQVEIIKCKKTSVEAEYLAKKNPCILISVFEDAFDLLDEETQEFAIRKGIQGISYNLEKGTIKINNDIVFNVVELRKFHQYTNNHKEFLDMLGAEKAAIQQVLDMRKAEKEK